MWWAEWPLSTWCNSMTLWVVFLAKAELGFCLIRNSSNPDRASWKWLLWCCCFAWYGTAVVEAYNWSVGQSDKGPTCEFQPAMTFRLGNPLSRKNVKQFDGESFFSKKQRYSRLVVWKGTRRLPIYLPSAFHWWGKSFIIVSEICVWCTGSNRTTCSKCMGCCIKSKSLGISSKSGSIWSGTLLLERESVVIWDLKANWETMWSSSASLTCNFTNTRTKLYPFPRSNHLQDHVCRKSAWYNFA